MPDNKRYVELLWAEKYDKYEKGEKIPMALLQKGYTRIA